MYVTNEFRKGIKIEIDGTPYKIVDFQHVSPGKGGAFTRTKLQNLLNGNVTERTFKSGDTVKQANTDDADMQYLYSDAAGYHFMNTQTYDQIALSKEFLGASVNYLQENIKVKVLHFNERPIAVELPTFVELKVVETEPGIRGDTASGGSKPAMMDTGAKVNVPFHIKEGDVLKVDTRDGKYVEKVNKKS